MCHGGATLETVLCVYVEVPALRALKVPVDVNTMPLDADVTVALVGFGSVGRSVAGALGVKLSVRVVNKLTHGTNYATGYTVAI